MCFVERQNFLRVSMINPRMYSDQDSLSKCSCSETTDSAAENSPNVPVCMLGCSVVSNSLWPHGLQSARILYPCGFSRKEHGSGLPRPPPRDFSTQGPNPGLLHCRILYHPSHRGSPRILELVTYPFSRRFSWPRNRTRVSCIAGRFFTSWTTREAQCISVVMFK